MTDAEYYEHLKCDCKDKEPVLKDRFKMSDQLCSILRNTAERMPVQQKK